MKLISFSERLFSSSTLPPSLRAMRVLTLMGIAISVATLLVSLSITRGFERSYKKSILDFNAHIALLSSGRREDDAVVWKRVQELVHKQTEIVGVTRFLYREGLVIAKGKILGVVIKGIDPEHFFPISRMKITPSDGTSLSGRSVLLGSSVAKEFEGVGVGETVSLMVPGDHRDPYTPLTILGTFESGLYDYDAQFALMDLHSAQALFEATDDITGIEVTLADPERAEEVIHELEEWLPESYQPMSWMELNRDLFVAIRLEKITFAIIMGMLVIVAAMNVMSVLVLEGLARKKTFSILAALGMQRTDRQCLLTWSGVRAGFFGAAWGLGVGLVVLFCLHTFSVITLSPEVYFLDRLPLDISGVLCGIIGVFCLFVCTGASFVASRVIHSHSLRCEDSADAD